MSQRIEVKSRKLEDPLRSSMYGLEAISFSPDFLARLAAYQFKFGEALDKLRENGHQPTEQEVALVRTPLMEEFGLANTLVPKKKSKEHSGKKGT